MKYLDNTNDFNGNYWPALVKSNDDYPHAPWWTFRGNIENEWGYNPTAKLAGFILRFADKDSDIYHKAEIITQQSVDRYLSGTTPEGKMYKSIYREGEINCYISLITSVERNEIKELSGISDLKNEIIKQSKEFLEHDASKWNTYCRKPSAFINSPENILYESNREIMNSELDFMIGNINKEGIWDITWEWNGYERQFAISENWWKAHFAVSNLVMLRRFGRL